MSSVQPAVQLSTSWTDEERRHRLQQVYLYILSLRPKKTTDQAETIETVTASEDSGTTVPLPEGD